MLQVNNTREKRTQIDRGRNVRIHEYMKRVQSGLWPEELRAEANRIKRN